jgi:hypothetical protein
LTVSVPVAGSRVKLITRETSNAVTKTLRPSGVIASANGLCAQAIGSGAMFATQGLLRTRSALTFSSECHMP